MGRVRGPGGAVRRAFLAQPRTRGNPRLLLTLPHRGPPQVWMGLWDLIDNHLLRDTIGAKLALVLCSLVAVYFNRTLYDKKLLDSRERERARRRSVAVNGAEGRAGVDEGAATTQAPASKAGTSSPASVELSGGPTPDLSPDVIEKHLPAQPTQHEAALYNSPWKSPNVTRTVSKRMIRMVAAQHADEAPAMRRLYFDAPPFKLRSFLRASFALLAGLTLWIGAWDLIDYHIIRAVFECCRKPDWPCAFVKAGLVVVGLFGLYVTRSLYGEEAVKNPHFQRMT